VRLLVVGATGRTGTRVVEHAVAAGHTVRALGRSAGGRAWPEGVEPLALDILDEGVAYEAIEGMDAVVTALSIPRTSRSPFAPVVGPSDLHRRSTELLADAMTRNGVGRIVKLSAQGVGESATRAGWGFRLLVAVSNLGPAFRDHGLADDALRATDLAWTVVRPPILAEGPGRVEARPDASTWTWTRVSLDAVAAWVVGALDDEATIRQTLTLTPS